MAAAGPPQVSFQGEGSGRLPGVGEAGMGYRGEGRPGVDSCWVLGRRCMVEVHLNQLHLITGKKRTHTFVNNYYFFW